MWGGYLGSRRTWTSYEATFSSKSDSLMLTWRLPCYSSQERQFGNLHRLVALAVHYEMTHVREHWLQVGMTSCFIVRSNTRVQRVCARRRAHQALCSMRHRTERTDEELLQPSTTKGCQSSSAAANDSKQLPRQLSNPRTRHVPAASGSENSRPCPSTLAHSSESLSFDPMQRPHVVADQLGS